MSQMSLKANGAEFRAGDDPAELCTVNFGMNAELDEDGRFTHRPRAATGRVSRRMLLKDGKLSLLALTLSGQRFNLLAQQADKHPVAEMVLDKQAGGQLVPLYKVVMKDVQPIRWRLTWTGGGDDGLSGATFVESVTMKCSNGEVWNLTDNTKAEFNLG
jgi:hypothetical protein